MTEFFKIRCDDCKFQESCVDYGWEGCKKFTQKASEQMTNEEWIKSANTEQLAGFLALKFDLCGAGCHNCFLKDPCLTEAKNGDYKTQEEMIAEWLMKPHEAE